MHDVTSIYIHPLVITEQAATLLESKQVDVINVTHVLLKRVHHTYMDKRSCLSVHLCQCSSARYEGREHLAGHGSGKWDVAHAVPVGIHTS